MSGTKKLMFCIDTDKTWTLYYTDDTEMAHAMAASLVKEKSFSAQKIAKELSFNNRVFWVWNVFQGVLKMGNTYHHYVNIDVKAK